MPASESYPYRRDWSLGLLPLAQVRRSVLQECIHILRLRCRDVGKVRGHVDLRRAGGQPPRMASTATDRVCRDGQVGNVVVRQAEKVVR